MQRIFFLPVWLMPLLILFNSLLPSYGYADGITFNSQLNYSSTDSQIKNKTTGEKRDAETYRFDQVHNLEVSKSIYPYLSFRTGTIFELDKASSKSEGTRIEAEETLFQPFVRLDLNNPLYQAGLQYIRTEITQDVDGLPKTEDTRDSFNASLGWRPADLPQLDLRYRQIHSRDDPETVDEIEKQYTLQTKYTVWKKLRLDYLYTRLDTEDRIENFDTLRQNHFGTIQYGDNYLDSRLYFNTSYRIRYNTLKLTGAGTAAVPLQRSQGLFSLDDTPQDGPALAANIALIDGNLIASAGIDIGLGGDQTTLTNIGLDLGSEVSVDQIRIWVDRRLSAPVANSFSWDIYTSPDNTNTSTWTLVDTVSPATFGTFDNRFEIQFSAVRTRFIKVVTTALSPGVPDATNFPNIFVTEMQAFIPASAADQDKFTNITHTYLLNLTGRLSDKTSLGYNFQFISEDEEAPSRDRTRLFNQIFLSHIFSKVFSLNATFSREDTKEDNDDRVSYTYGASMTGAYLPTFDQRLTFSGTNTTEDEGSADSYSIVLRNNATLYKRWSAFLDLGYARSSNLEDVRTINNFLRVGTDVVPNNKITFNLTYQLDKADQRNGAREKTSESRLAFNVFFTPYRTLSFSAKIEYVDREDLDTTVQEYFASWSPFPDGDLQIFFNYNEKLNPQDNRKLRSIGPGLNWNISRHFTLEMTYNIVRDETNTQKIDNNSLFARLRINF